MKAYRYVLMNEDEILEYYENKDKHDDPAIPVQDDPPEFDWQPHPIFFRLDHVSSPITIRKDRNIMDVRIAGAEYSLVHDQEILDQIEEYFDKKDSEALNNK